jgi:hypothetical protein
LREVVGMKKDALIYILVCGSIWGLIEATLGAALHLVHVPLSGTVMASIGYTALLVALRHGVPPRALLAVSLVAASWKILDASVLGVPPLDPAVIRPVLSIASQGLAFSLFFGWRGAWDRPASLAPRLLVTAAASEALFRAASFAALGQSRGRATDDASVVLLELALTTMGAVALFAAAECPTPRSRGLRDDG